VEKSAGSKILFVCTKPYQYLMARLIKEGCGFGRCDIVILNHFYEAADFARKVRETGVWQKVMYIEDGKLDEYKLGLHPLRKYLFYHGWRKMVPPVLSDISAYSEVFVAHDFVALEYAVMRKFSSENKPVHLYEEGFGNYINNSTHTRWHMRLLKRAAPWFGLPGGYFGSVKWIDSVWLQRPGLITSDRSNPIRRKTRGMPLAFNLFLDIPHIIEECYRIYPELHEIDLQIEGHDTISVILTDPFLDEMPDRPACIREMQDKVNAVLGHTAEAPLFIKQHPGEKLSVDGIGGRMLTLPKKLPCELLYLIILKNQIRKINLFSFGSTAILNLYDLCRTDNNMDIFIIDSMSLREEVKVISTRFCELAQKHHIEFQTV
jgi:hypothetical protein